MRRMPRIVHMLALACASLAMLGATLGDAARAAESAAKPDAPPADEIRSRLPPDRAKALHDWTYSLALQAATWGYPLVVMYNLRQNVAFGATPKAPPNDLWRMSDITTPELARQARYVTPNVNTLYGFGFLDLGPEPVILSLPDSKGLYYMVEVVDMWTNAFAYPAGAAAGYEGGVYALTRPGWSGELPAGVRRLEAPTRWVMIQPRVHVRSQGDLAEAQAVLGAIAVKPLSAWLGQPAPAAPVYDYPVPNVTDDTQSASVLNYRDPLQFWDLLSSALNENPPPPDQAAALLPQFAPLGLELGAKWDRAKINPIILDAMAEAARQIAPLLAILPLGQFVNGWVLPPPSIGNFGADYKVRAVTARVGLTANTPKEAIYIYGLADAEGKLLDGAKRYELTLRQTPPFVEPGFWSLTMYDGKNNYTVPNSINRYALGSDNALKRNADGSVTISIQADEPAGAPPENWLPAPKGPFYLILRSYSPGKAMIDALTDPKGFPLPPVREAQ
ncbi:MAG: DUF1254 domain-containing protein [Methylocella sp.]